MNLPRLSVRNPVATNLLMWSILVGGFLAALTINREFFPNVAPDQIFIFIPYPGAAPEEVEKGVTRPLERELMDVRDVEEIRSQIYESLSLTIVELEEGADGERILNDVRGELDLARTEFPRDVEEPRIVLVRPFIPVIAVMLFGDVSDEQLHDAALRVRDDLLAMPGVARAIVSGTRQRELWAEVDPLRLEAYGLSFEEVGQALRVLNVDVPGGRLRSPRGEVGVRTVGETSRARELEQFVIAARPDGTSLRLSDVARVYETFEDRPERGFFQGKPAAQILIFKSPNADAITLAQQVKDYVRRKEPELLGGAIQVTTTTDLSRFIADRLDLMVRNALQGFLLVVLTLAAMLDLKVALWVAWGLPTAFLGTFLVMALTGITFNLVSLFGLIMVLGLIVDDAIVIGENAYRRAQEGEPLEKAAVEGANEVAGPVLAAVLTNVAAFVPLAFIEGRIGALLAQVPIVMSIASMVSLLEAFAILPAHLAHRRDRGLLERSSLTRWLRQRVNQWKHQAFERSLPSLYHGLLRRSIPWRYSVISALVAFLLLVAGMVVGGAVPFVLLQEADAETMSVTLEMASGTSEERTETTVRSLEEWIRSLPEVKHVFAVVGTAVNERGELYPSEPSTLGQLTVELRPAAERELAGLRRSDQVARDIERYGGSLPGLKRLQVIAHSGGPAGPDIEIRVRGDDLRALLEAVGYVRRELSAYAGVTQVEDDLKLGKVEARLTLRETARPLGLTTLQAALLVRHALFGFEVQELQMEREGWKVRVLLPQELRSNFSDLGRLRVPTPVGARVPLDEVVRFRTDRGYATLAHVDGQRAFTVSAEVDERVGNVAEITSDLEKRLQNIGQRYPGVSVAFVGQRKETADAFGSLKIAYPAALLAIYAIVAVIFRSYLQPFLVLTAAPFALAGAVVGHWIMGYPFTLLSTIGAVALTGVAVNDAIVLVDFINSARRGGLPLREAVLQAGRLRLRPVLLTTITTIAGVAPIMLEKSFQAQFLIPMAISMAWGLAAATLNTLFLVPLLYLVLEDLKTAFGWSSTA
jgi:HAE1 family hydrophobic/amphiphilic exporter-1